MASIFAVEITTELITVVGGVAVISGQFAYIAAKVNELNRRVDRLEKR